MILNNEGADLSAPCHFVNSSKGFDSLNPLHLVSSRSLLITVFLEAIHDTKLFFRNG